MVSESLRSPGQRTSLIILERGYLLEIPLKDVMSRGKIPCIVGETARACDDGMGLRARSRTLVQFPNNVNAYRGRIIPALHVERNLGSQIICFTCNKDRAISATRLSLVPPPAFLKQALNIWLKALAGQSRIGDSAAGLDDV